MANPEPKIAFELHQYGNVHIIVQHEKMQGRDVDHIIVQPFVKNESTLPPHVLIQNGEIRIIFPKSKLPFKL